MNVERHSPEELKNAIERGTFSDLKFACELVEKFADIVVGLGNTDTLPEGFRAFRARNDYVEIVDDERGTINHHPLDEREICAPGANLVGLGRFNRKNKPVLYLSTSKEVALAECRALPSDICTVASFRTVRPCRIATFLPSQGVPLGWLMQDEPEPVEYDKWLNYQMAEFLPRRPSGASRDLHYRTCNLVASIFEERGFDGLAYRTSFWSSKWRNSENSYKEDILRSANIVFFDPKVAKVGNRRLFNINWQRPVAEEAG